MKGYLTDTWIIKKERKWIFSFINKYFGNNSYLLFTDYEKSKTKANYISKGSFDYTLLKKGFLPTNVPIKKRNAFDEE